MPKKSIPQLKDKFQKGDKPMQEDFYDLLDSFIHRDEDISKILIKIASISEAENGSDNVKHMTPLLTKKAIYALTRLADIPDLATEVQQKIDASINSLLTLEDADNVINTVKDVLDFVQGAGEDLNIITEFGKKVDKTSISHAIDNSSTTSVASSKAVNDAKNSARSNAVSDVRGGVGSSWDTLKKFYDWAVSLFNTKIDKSVMSGDISSTSTTNVATSKAVKDAKDNTIAAAASDATSKAGSARSGAVSDVRGGVVAAQNTLKKLYDWANDLFNAKVDKSVMSSSISSTSTIYVATSKAVKDAKENATKLSPSNDYTGSAKGVEFYSYDNVSCEGIYGAFWQAGSLVYLYIGKTYDDAGIKIYPDKRVELGETTVTDVIIK